MNIHPRKIADIVQRALRYFRGHTPRTRPVMRKAPGSDFTSGQQPVDSDPLAHQSSDADSSLLAALAQIREEMAQDRARAAAQQKLLEELRAKVQMQSRMTRLLLDRSVAGSGPEITAETLIPQAAMARPATVATELPRPMLRQGLVTLNKVRTDRPALALTFDDGPHPVHTPVLLDILAARGILATFYVIGAKVKRYPEIVKRMVSEGHELGNHTWSHLNLTSQSDAAVLQEIDTTQEIIWRTVGHVPATMRPPYGEFNKKQRQMLAAERNLPTVIWSVNSQDWRRPGEQVVVDRIVGGAHPGAIVLAHDIHGPTTSAMPAVLDGLQARGFACMTLSELLGWGRWGTGTTPHP
jgi:peptidoglycan/xylan/chitin deacetylase (PgdA/CDA1 family)